MKKFNEIEKLVMAALLNGRSKGIQLLQHQYNNSTISKIEETDCGLFFYYTVDVHFKEKFKTDVQFGDIVIKFSNDENLYGAVIFVQQGFLKTLELYSYGDTWPKKMEGISIHYLNKERDFAKLEAAV